MPYDSSGNHIWLTTAERTPYLYVEGKIKTRLQFELISSTLSTELETYDMVDYQTRAFGLTNSATSAFDLFLLHDNMKFAFIWIVNEKIAFDTSTNEYFAMLDRVYNEKSTRIEEILKKEDGTLKLENINLGMQISLPSQGN